MPDAYLEKTNTLSRLRELANEAERDARLKKTLNRCVKRFIRVDTGLIAASIAVLGIGFALNLAGTDAIWSAHTEPQAEPTGTGAIHPKSFNFIGSVGSPIPDGPGLRVAGLQTEVVPGSAGETERPSEPFAASAPCAAFDERFYFDRQLDSFDERFASAFGSPGNARGKVAEAGEHAEDMLLQQLEQPKRNPLVARSASERAPTITSRLASLPEERLNSAEASRGLSLAPDADSHTAIYDIVARTVYLPNGHRLEAHSGLGSRLDDPRYVSTKGQGPTPPNVYNLALRERLFHGVRAIRLIPVNDGKMFGRDGILAHSYMLGPNGQSNGCVSFRNYAAFLSAFLRGEVDRLVVVEHLATTAGAKTSMANGG